MNEDITGQRTEFKLQSNQLGEQPKVQLADTAKPGKDLGVGVNEMAFE